MVAQGDMITTSAASPFGKTAGVIAPTALGQTSMRQQTLDEVSSDVQCPTCGRVDFKSEKGLKQHHSRTHGESLTTVALTCENCGVEYERYPEYVDGSRFCSRDCKHEGMQGDGHPNYTTQSLPCSNCGEPVETNRNERRRLKNHFCDSDCMYAFQTGENHPNANRDTRPCEQCGTSITRCVAHFGESGPGPFCSHDCYGEWLSENNHGPDHHQWTRERVECSQCGEKLFRKQHQLDGRNHVCSYGCLGEWHSEHNYAEAHPNWRGGYRIADILRRSLGSRSWESHRRDALKHSEGGCEMCGEVSEQELDVHHIVPLLYGGINGAWNLIGVCKSCHGKAERYIESIPEINPILTE